MRIDKFLSLSGCCSRADAKRAIRAKGVTVNGIAVKAPDDKINPKSDKVVYFGKEVVYREYNYIMLNKPDGVVSATEDTREKTVLDILPEDVRNERMFPCGRLDKNTLGLVMITDDGALAHELLAPKSHVSKSYAFKSEFAISDDDVKRLEEGVLIGDYITKPAKVKLSEDKVSGIITLTEGKYHQIKRMLSAIDNKITYLERISFGPITLDKTLQRGEWRYLTEEETEKLKKHKANIKNGEQ